MVPKHDGCFVDVGANIGTWTFYMAKQKITVHAFEPSPRPYKTLKKRSKTFRNIRIYPYALGEKSHEAKIYIHKASGNNSLIKRRRNFTGISVRIVVRTLDSFRLSNVGLIKIDTEGYEIPILLGARQTIWRYKPRFVVEVHRPHEEQIRKILEILKQLNYYWVIRYKGTKPHIIADHKNHIT